MPRVLATLGLLLLAFPVQAADEISAEADHVFWCASAFYWMAGDADDVGNAKEAEQYDHWAGQLTERGFGILRTEQVAESRFADIVDRYDNAVLSELKSEKTRYDIATCVEMTAEQKD